MHSHLMRPRQGRTTRGRPRAAWRKDETGGWGLHRGAARPRRGWRAGFLHGTVRVYVSKLTVSFRTGCRGAKEAARDAAKDPAKDPAKDGAKDGGES